MLTGGTSLATLIALAIFGGEVIRPFALVLFFGIFTGMFSSIHRGAGAARDRAALAGHRGPEHQTRHGCPGDRLESVLSLTRPRS
ncbi:MAG: hypothetical protein ABI647_21350 [Gemmatimonadota bacterium]